MRFRLRALAVAGTIGAVLFGTAPAPASADVAGPVVLLGTAGVRWADVDDSTPALKQLLDQGSTGWLAVRSVRSVACPVDGWLAVSAGRRAGDVPVGVTVKRQEPSCREPQLDPSTAGGPATVTDWADYRAEADAGTFDALPGLFGNALAKGTVSTAAVGPGAAIALADSEGRVPRAWPGRVDNSSGPVAPTELAQDVRAALATGPDLAVVDLGVIRDPARQVSGAPALLGAYTRPKLEQVRALDARLALVLAELPANATVIVGSLADSGSPSQLQLLAARGPAPLAGSFATSLLGSESTRQDGLAQTTDLPPTLLTALSVPVPVDAVGSPLKAVWTERSTAQRAQKLSDLADASVQVTPIVPWIFNGLVVAQLVLYGAATLVLRRRARSDDPATAALARRHTLSGLRRAAVVFATFPAATFLANLFPWWRYENPRLVVTGIVIMFMIPIAAVALLGPWRRAVLGPLGAVGAITAVILALDVATGSHLLLSSLMGVQPIVAGRFYGFSNPSFALFATGSLLIAIALGDHLVRAGRRRQAAAAIGLIGVLATLVDGAPGLGSDFGGPPAIIPAFAVLALMVAGVKVTWRRALLIALVTVAVLVALGVLDWLRAPGDRTHLGRFVQSVIDGGAGSVIKRKADQNIKILFTSYLSALLPFAAAFVFFVLSKPAAWGVRPLQLAYDRSPVLRPGMVAFGVMMLIGALMNDSGAVVPANAAIVAIPLLIAASVRALELQDAEPAAAATEAVGTPS